MVGSQAANRRHGEQGSKRWLAYVGDCPKVTEYINHRKSTAWEVIKFSNALFRGYGQVVFANNPFSGVLVMIALFWADFAVGLKGLFSSVIALVVSMILRHPKEAIENGLTVFNPLLLGQVCGGLLPARFGIDFELQHWVLLALGSVFTLFVAASLSSLLGSIGEFPIPCLALPFCVVQFLFFVTSVHLKGTEVVLSPLNTTLPSTHANIVLPSSNDLDHVSTALEGYSSQEETTIYFKLPSTSLSRNQNNATTPSMPTSMPKINVVQLADMKAEVRESSIATNSYVEVGTTRADNETETNYDVELVTAPVNMTNNDLNNKSITNKTPEKTSRHRRNSDVVEEGVKAELLDWGQVFAGIILSMSQVFGACHVPGAAMIYLAVLLYSPITAAFCLAGAIIATISGIGLSSTSYALVYSGVWGFNGLLVAGAFSFLYIVTWQSVFVAIISVLFNTLLQNLLMLSMEEANLPVVSIPFNLTMMLFLCLGPDADGRGLIRPQTISFPEKQRAAYLQQCEEGQQEQPKASTLPLTVQEEPGNEKRAPLADQEVV